jgi:hypothetical protein
VRRGALDCGSGRALFRARSGLAVILPARPNIFSDLGPVLVPRLKSGAGLALARPAKANQHNTHDIYVL